MGVGKITPQFMSVTQNEHGQMNVFAKEPQMYIDPIMEEQMENNTYKTHNEKAELLNGRVAMIGIMAALLNYASTGQIIPGIW